MKRIRRVISAALVAVLTYGILGSSLYGVFAATVPINLIVDKYENGKLDFHWTGLTGTASCVISYHNPDSTDNPVPVTVTRDGNGNTASLTGLKADYIYDIEVRLYDAAGGAGNMIGRGLLYYLPSVTFTATPVSQTYDTIVGGGREIGAKPKMKLRWRMPKAYNGTDKFVYLDTVLTNMQNTLDNVYDDGRELSSFNFRINISTQLNLLNSGSAQSALLIEPGSGGNYKASVSNSSVPSATVVNELNGSGVRTGYMNFELWGRADETAAVPTTSSINILADDDIYPGTVYYMNIKPVFKNADGTNVNAVTVGNPSDQNGSLLSGERSYTSTPIRFQLTKDSANNIYVKIYKINKGSLDLPRLFYEVQATDDPAIQGDWTVKKTMDDSYFSGATAVTIITGVNPNNEVYYKIVVKSDSAEDRLESLPMPYVLTVDTSRPPLPTGIALEGRTLNVGQVTLPSGTSITVKSTDVTISWDKPLNWDTVKNNLYFHFLLNTNQAELTADSLLYVGDTFYGNYPPKYRLVKYVSAMSTAIEVKGNRLSYTIKAYDLFTGVNGDGSTDVIPNPEKYPAFLLPNTVYYLQMYTTKAADKGTSDKTKMSDKSIVQSLTTLNGIELDVPLPMSFGVSGNGKETVGSAVRNYIELKFDKISNLNWNNYTDVYDTKAYTYDTYYDLYMNTHTDTNFLLVGTTETTLGGIRFTGHDVPESTSIKARAVELTSPDAISLFGNNLLPNTTYYFKVRTRLVQRDRSTGNIVMKKESMDTAILPVTTIQIVVTPPDDSQRKPLAPTDFDIATDSDQNPLVTGNSVTFNWKRQENDVVYQLICTTQKVSPTDLPSVYTNDPEYVSFLTDFGNYTETVSGTAIRKCYLDPTKATTAYSGRLTYNAATKTCTYTVDKRLFPNKLYYFSLKAVRVNSQRDPLSASSESVWVSIPVTTSLIDPPASLEVVVASELGFFWTDPTAGLTAEDYKIYAKISSEADYKALTRSQATIVKDRDGETYYGRITGLKRNTYYDVRVTKGAGTPVYEETGFKTRDGYHEIEVKWSGKPVDKYSRYDIALMAEGGKEYTVLTASDLEQYVDKDGASLPYYTEETATTVGTDAVYYHARIRSAEVELAGGIVTHQPLRSNVKYFVKVRAVKVDPTETDLISYSKFIGPVNIRTEFNQGDYDNTDREEKQKAVFLDKMQDLEKGYFWRVSITDGTASRILLKGDRVADAMKNSSGDSFTVDMTKLSVNINKDEIYVPVGIVKVMNTMNRSLVIRTSAAELTLRPATLDASANDQIKEILTRSEVKDLYFRLDITRATTGSTALPSTLKRASDINELDVQAWGLSSTDSDLKQLFHDKLYDKDNGLVNEKLNMLQNAYVGEGTGSSSLIDQYTQSLIELIEKELSGYIGSTLDSVKLSNAVRDITSFGAPASASLSVSGGKGIRLPYVLYDDSAAWQKLSSGVVQSGTSVRFNLMKTGKYVILTGQADISDVPSGYWAESYITSLTSKYDLGGVFAGISSGFMPENKVTCTEVVLLYEKVTGKTTEDAGLDIRQKTVRLGLDGIIGPNALVKNIRRQETAAVLLKLFSAKKGVNAASLKPGGNIDIADEESIADAFYGPVVMIVDMKVMSVDGSGKFRPDSQMTRAELAEAFVKLLDKAGE